MALRSKLFTEESPGKPVLARCAETHAGHLLRGMSSSPAIKDAVARVQRALRQLGFTVNDPEGIYGASTEAAVLKFKGPPRNILGPGQTRPDAIVGIQTIHRLDSEIGGGNTPPQPPLEFGSNKWRFTFFGNKSAFKPGVYSLFIASEEVPDSQSFNMSELSADGDLISGFKGETRGTFQTASKFKAVDFNNAVSNLFIDKKGRLITGFVQLTVPAKSLTLNLKFATFENEGLLGSFSNGTLLVKGDIRKN
ncbi:hypothetical protein F183_A16290 [Bryobacterales bacterium F-183]|nr:hypothetical protein F183_A16290 [Bryobacterales bacterium F-183]